VTSRGRAGPDRAEPDRAEPELALRRGVAVYRDVVFARPVGFRPLSLDLYVPPRPAQALCLYLHGGGWRVGGRADGPGRAKNWSPSFFERVAALGLAIASIDYRLSGEAVFPAQREDVAEAARFLAARRSAYSIATPQTVAWGVSAGGHLAALHALTDPAALDAVVCWYTPTDLGALPGDVDDAGGRGERGPEARESQLIGAPPTERPDLAVAASPVTFAHAGAPPFLFLHGDADALVPPRQSQRLAQALSAAGATATVELVPGAGHMFPELDDAETRRVVERSVEFLLQAASG
jgi:acetyl esterase/lipase